MAMTVEELIRRVRAAVHDEQETGYSDETLTGYINDGIRFLRRTVFAINPLLLTDVDVSGTLAPGESRIAAGARLSHVSAVRVGGRLLTQVNPNEIEDLSEAGEPRYYYLTGLSAVQVYPVPQEAAAYHLVGTRDMELLTKGSDVSPFLHDMDDWLLEYVNIRALMSNEFETSQETSVMSDIIAQMEALLHGLAPHGIQTRGYWDEGAKL